jgi:hypothetical protein
MIVLFPEPVSPTMAKVCLGGTEKETPFSIHSSFAYELQTLSKTISPL